MLHTGIPTNWDITVPEGFINQVVSSKTIYRKVYQAKTYVLGIYYTEGYSPRSFEYFTPNSGYAINHKQNSEKSHFCATRY
jgi:hypothetical protein